MTELREAPSNEGGEITLFHIVVVCLSLTLTMGAWQFSIYQVKNRTALRFEAARDQALGLITNGMNKYEDALWAGVAAVDSHGGEISYQDWRTFAHRLRIEERYPGIGGIGVIIDVAPDEMAGFLAEQRQERPGFRVFPEHDSPYLMPITYIEPEELNNFAVGLDVAHETNRRTAALASRDTGQAQITGPIVLVQDAGKTPGFLFYAPVFKGGRQADINARRETFLGAVYAPFVVHKLMDGLLAKELRHVRFSIRDGNELIYDEHSVDDPANDPEPMFSEHVEIALYGRTWTLDMRTNHVFRDENRNTKPTIILIAGLLIEALIITLLVLMARANKRSVAYADQVTLALRQEKRKLVETNSELTSKNEELERFAYVASHDLKTPIRGISGLTEMVQEDLEDYFATGAANPDVSSNLERIQSRIQRMEMLTNGIMEISRVDQSDLESTPIQLDAVVAELVQDFKIRPDQLIYDGASELTCVDQTNLCSVIENLIGNAIKYHDDKPGLIINVSASVRGNRLEVSVADNGPGIDPKFHDRIFEVFQTLRLGSAPESTGIGLAIVKKAVERHGGTVKLTSTPGEGATFSFDWPLASDRTETNGKAA